MWREYHEATKHTVESLRSSRHSLDWANMPDPFRHYEGVPVLDLPADPPSPRIPALELLEGACGHTPGSVMLHVQGGGRRALLSGDVVHHPVQLADPTLRIHDEYDRVLSEAVRRRMIENLADVDTLLLAAHFPTPTVGRIVSRKGAAVFQYDEH